jgi:hypothetical protein
VKLILYHPFVDWIDLLSIDSQIYRSYINAFQACYCSHAHLQDFYTDPEAECSDSDDESDEDPQEQEQADDNYPLADFEAFARQRPQEDFICIDLFESLGTQKMDCNYNWSSHVS